MDYEHESSLRAGGQELMNRMRGLTMRAECRSIQDLRLRRDDARAGFFASVKARNSEARSAR